MSAPASFAIANVFTGEVLDPDDLPALKNALEEIEDYLAEKRRPLRRIYQARDQIQARVAQLDPIGLPRPSKQTDKQRKVDRCPRCSSVIEISHQQDAADRRAVSDSAEEGPCSPTPPERGSAAQGAGDGGTHLGLKGLDSEPQAGHTSASQTPTAPVSAATGGHSSEQPSESKKLAAAAGPAVGAEAPVPPQKQAPSPPAGDVPDGASPALPLKEKA